jgi:hypothetical protein
MRQRASQTSPKAGQIVEEETFVVESELSVGNANVASLFIESDHVMMLKISLDLLTQGTTHITNQKFQKT